MLNQQSGVEVLLVLGWYNFYCASVDVVTVGAAAGVDLCPSDVVLLTNECSSPE